jgi:hypothetical protein
MFLIQYLQLFSSYKQLALRRRLRYRGILDFFRRMLNTNWSIVRREDRENMSQLQTTKQIVLVIGFPKNLNWLSSLSWTLKQL